MKFHRFCAFLLMLAIAGAMLVGCSLVDNNQNTGTSGGTLEPDGGQEPDGNEILSFHPVDCGIQSQDAYEYPFLGLNFLLSQDILNKIDSREIFVYTQEDYTEDCAIAYGLLRFSATTQVQREQEVMSIDIIEWEENLEKIGAIGAYQKDMVSRLDELTLCDTHAKIGESPDGTYEYYLSTNSSGDAALVASLQNTNVTIVPIHTLNMELGYSAFSTDRLEGIDNVGHFSTEDVFGNAYDETLFQNYDLTLVNVFATWCSPCVEEMPELEKLRQEYADKGIRLGIVAVVLDTKAGAGTDAGAVERAQTLSQKSGAQFPFLIPDDGNLNGRLTGIESVPESFFVDGSGNIVSEPYIGARNLAQWRQVVDAEFAALQGDGQ